MVMLLFLGIDVMKVVVLVVYGLMVVFVFKKVVKFVLGESILIEGVVGGVGLLIGFYIGVYLVFLELIMEMMIEIVGFVMVGKFVL